MKYALAPCAQQSAKAIDVAAAVPAVRRPRPPRLVLLLVIILLLLLLPVIRSSLLADRRCRVVSVVVVAVVFGLGWCGVVGCLELCVWFAFVLVLLLHAEANGNGRRVLTRGEID